MMDTVHFFTFFKRHEKIEISEHTTSPTKSLGAPSNYHMLRLIYVMRERRLGNVDEVNEPVHCPDLATSYFHMFGSLAISNLFIDFYSK